MEVGTWHDPRGRWRRLHPRVEPSQGHAPRGLGRWSVDVEPAGPAMPTREASLDRTLARNGVARVEVGRSPEVGRGVRRLSQVGQHVAQ